MTPRSLQWAKLGFRRGEGAFAKLLAAVRTLHRMSCLRPPPMSIVASFWRCASSCNDALPARQRPFDFFALLNLTVASARGSFRHIGPRLLRFPAATEPLLTLVWLLRVGTWASLAMGSRLVVPRPAQLVRGFDPHGQQVV